jgi:hypothetical protein
MDCSEAGRRGGQSRSAAKRAASARNLELARQLRALMSETEAQVAEARAKGVTDTNATQWLEDARINIKNLETPGYVQRPLVLVAHQKASK